MDVVRKFIQKHYAASALESVDMEQQLTVYSKLYNRSEGIEIRQL